MITTSQRLFFHLLLATVAVWTPSVASGQWEVKPFGGTPALWRDGQPVTPMIFWQSYPLQYEVEAFSKEGIDLFSFFRSGQHYAHPYWRADGTFDFTFLDEGIRELFRFAPQAYCMPRLFATAPQWWIEQNPGETCQFSLDVKVTPRESFASDKCLSEMGAAYRQAVRHIVEADYGPRVLGIHVTNGPWGENFYWDAAAPHSASPPGSDVSEPMRRALIDYTRTKYGNDVARLRRAWNDDSLTFDTIQVPGVEQRKATVDGAWRDPAQSRAVMDYFECHNQVVVRMLDHYCRIVKQASDGKLLTLVFYGYTQDENWPIECDHRAISQLLRLDSVDMLSAPHTYYRRGLGGDALMRQYLGSATLHGKLFFDEGDDQTHLERLKPRPDHRAYALTAEHSKTFLYREFGNMATHGIGLWYMDLNGGWFRDAELVDAVGRMKKWADVSMHHCRKRDSQVAVISAPESEFYLNYRKSPGNEIGYGLYHDQVGEFFRAGAPFDWYLIDDLAAIKDRGYKVYIFLDCFYLTDAQRNTIRQLQSGDRTLMWFYAPGYASHDNLSKTRMEELTGLHFQQASQGTLQGVMVDTRQTLGIAKTQKSLFTVAPEPGVQALAFGTDELAEKIVLAERRCPGWTSIFSAVPGIPGDVLGAIYTRAGVHRYTTSDDVLSANESWLMLHTRTAGTKRIRLPHKCSKVTEITTETLIGQHIDHFQIDLPQYATAVFLLEP